MILCDVRASGITGDVADSYLVDGEPQPNGPLEMFVVSFVPAVSPSPPRSGC